MSLGECKSLEGRGPGECKSLEGKGPGRVQEPGRGRGMGGAGDSLTWAWNGAGVWEEGHERGMVQEPAGRRQLDRGRRGHDYGIRQGG